MPYGELMDVLEILRAGGYTKITLVALEGVPDEMRKRLRRPTSNPKHGIADVLTSIFPEQRSRPIWIIAALAP